MTYPIPQAFLTLDPLTHDLILETFSNGSRKKIYSGKDSSSLIFHAREELQQQADRIALQEARDKEEAKRLAAKRHDSLYVRVAHDFGRYFATKTIGDPPKRLRQAEQQNQITTTTTQQPGFDYSIISL